MLEDAIISIGHANEAARDRHDTLLAHRRPMRMLDHWLNQVEMLMERNVRAVPEPLIGEIAGFLGEQDPLLWRRLRAKEKLRASQVLDLLFEAEEGFLPRVARFDEDLIDESRLDQPLIELDRGDSSSLPEESVSAGSLALAGHSLGRRPV
jgi:hypothetical protein